MTKLQLSIFLVCVLLVTVGVGVSLGIAVGLEHAFVPALTAALVMVTAFYAFSTSRAVRVLRQQARIMEQEQLNSAAPVVMLEGKYGSRCFGSEGDRDKAILHEYCVVNQRNGILFEPNTSALEYTVKVALFVSHYR